MLTGPFKEIITMQGLPQRGPISDDQLHVIKNGAIVVERGKIREIGLFSDLIKRHKLEIEIDQPAVCLPGLIDAHTHICFAGNRCGDYTKRVSGKSYQQIASEGGGIMDSVRKTRAASQIDLEKGIISRAHELVRRGVTTCEVKSGYGLTIKDELKMLQAINDAASKVPLKLISTCLAAHIKPPEFIDEKSYLDHILVELLPKISSKRVDIFVEEGAFSKESAKHYLLEARKMGFSLIVHADQFSRQGALLACEVTALSADHLEVSSEEDADALAKADVIPIVLPGASLGLGMQFAPARMLLDRNLAVVIASDWNPGSAPMGDLLCQAAIMGAYEKLSVAETFAAITERAAKALQVPDRGVLDVGMSADLAIFPCSDYREILYAQGMMKPFLVVIDGKLAR